VPTKLPNDKSPTTSFTFSILSLSFLHQTKEKNDKTTHQRKESESKDFSKKKISNFNPMAPPYL